MIEPFVSNSDMVSRLVQLHASQANVRLKWSGHGAADIAMLCTDYQNKALLSQCLWNGMKELMAMPEVKELPDPIQAKLYSIVLQSQAVFELQIADRSLKKGTQASPQVPL
jgi:hypothetical protein